MNELALRRGLPVKRKRVTMLHYALVFLVIAPQPASLGLELGCRNRARSGDGASRSDDRLIDLENAQTGGNLWPALGEGVQARSQNDVLADAPGNLLHDEILDKASPGHNGCAEEACRLRVLSGRWRQLSSGPPASDRSRLRVHAAADRPGHALPATRPSGPRCYS